MQFEPCKLCGAAADQRCAPGCRNEHDCVSWGGSGMSGDHSNIAQAPVQRQDGAGVGQGETAAVVPLGSASLGGWEGYLDQVARRLADISGLSGAILGQPTPPAEVGFGPRQVALSPAKPPIPGVRHHLFNAETDFCVHCGVAAERAMDGRWHCTPATRPTCEGETIARAVRWHR